MIKFTSGDMFKINTDIRVNTVNCVGIMGAGVALAFKNKYPSMFKDYQKECKKGNLNPGKIHIWTDLSGECIINFPTKKHWRKPSKYEYIEAGLSDLHKYLLNKGQIRVAMPALGCDRGGLDWGRVKGMIEKHLDGLEATIFVFEPMDKARIIYSDETLQESEVELIHKGVKIVQSDSDSFPPALREKMISSMYVKGDNQILKRPILTFLSSMKPRACEVNAALACLELVARPGLGILVGYEHRLSRPIIRRALKLGSDVIISFPEGILNFSVRKDIKDVWDEKRIAVVTHVAPRQRWNPGATLKAKYLSLALANVALITDQDPTWLPDLAKTISIPIFYINYRELESIPPESLGMVNAKPVGENAQTSGSHVVPILESLGVNGSEPQSPTTKSSTLTAFSEETKPCSFETASERMNKEKSCI